MGIFANFLANAVSVDKTDDITALDRRVKNEMDRIIALGDADAPAAMQGANEVQSWATSTHTSGNATLGFTLENGETFTTGNIAFNAAAATIESAIDSAATAASITGWTNGDISVSGGAVNANPTVFTFDGTSVANTNPALIVVTDVDGSGGAFGAMSQTTSGQAQRDALAVIDNLGLATMTLPEQSGSVPSDLVGTFLPGQSPVSEPTLRALAREVEIQDGIVGMEAALLAAWNLPTLPTRGSQ